MDFKCDNCGEEFVIWDEGCYIGAANENDNSCEPCMDFLVLCPKCAKKREENGK